MISCGILGMMAILAFMGWDALLSRFSGSFEEGGMMNAGRKSFVIGARLWRQNAMGGNQNPVFESPLHGYIYPIAKNVG